MSDDIDRAIEQSHFASSEIVKGNAEPFQVLYSRREDVTLGNPFGPFVRGWERVAETAAGAAARYRDGEIVGFEPIARHIVLCDGDGVTSSDLRLFTFRNRRRPLFPFERDL